MAEGAETPNPTDVAIEELVAHTDRRRPLTIVCRPDDLLLHREMLAGPATRELLCSIAEWLDPSAVEGVAWSLRLGETFESRVLLRNRSAIPPRELRQTLRSRLDLLPRALLSFVEGMNPSNGGRRRVIGRFPAMLKAGAMGTRDVHATRLVEWNTLLPERAAPNLALAALLTWDESRRAHPPQNVAAAGKPAAPASIVERLKKPVAIDFRRTPLHEAIAFIAEEVSVPIELDGDGLKQAGYTRNMPQSLQMGTVSAMQGLAAILKQYEQMVVLIDEKQGKAMVTVRSVAASRGIKPLDLSQ
jgi:hypothetical protein